MSTVLVSLMENSVYPCRRPWRLSGPVFGSGNRLRGLTGVLASHEGILVASCRRHRGFRVGEHGVPRGFDSVWQILADEGFETHQLKGHMPTTISSLCFLGTCTGTNSRNQQRTTQWHSQKPLHTTRTKPALTKANTRTRAVAP